MASEAEELKPEAFQEFLERSRSGDDGPVVMLNLLAMKPNGGFEKYGEYGQAVMPILEKIGAEVVFSGLGGKALIGSEQDWDLVLLVRYPSRATFLEMIASPEYQAIAHLRTDALASSELRPLDAAPPALQA